MAIELESDLRYSHHAEVIDGPQGTDIETYWEKILGFRDQARHDASYNSWKKHKATGKLEKSIYNRLEYLTLPEPVEFYPTKIQIIKGKLADYNSNSEDGGFLISQAMKDAIETIDVDIHQFIPVEVLDKDGKEYGGPYYFWNVGGEVLDAVNYEHGGVDTIGQGPIDGSHAWQIKRGQVRADRTKNDLAVSKDIIKDRGVWKDLRFNRIFVSDALVDIWKEAGLTGWTATSDWDEV